MGTMTYVGVLQIETCCNCGISFAMAVDFYNMRREDHGTFYCPKGHPQFYTGKSDSEKLKDEISKLEQRNINLDHVINNKNHQILQLNYSVRAQKAAKTKILNRVKNGVCPCCNRTFKNLQNHFKSKHPELMDEKKPTP